MSISLSFRRESNAGNIRAQKKVTEQPKKAEDTQKIEKELKRVQKWIKVKTDFVRSGCRMCVCEAWLGE